MITTDAKAWKIVKDHNQIIQQSVNTAVGRGYLAYQDRKDAVHDCEITAYKLARRGNVRNYKHLLRRTLKLDLRRDGTRPGADAMDHSRQFIEVRDPDSGDNYQEDFPTEAPLQADDIERLEGNVEHLINTRVMPRLRPLARMRFLQRRTIKRIANSTGRSVWDVTLRLRECWKLMWGPRTHKTPQQLS